MSQCFDVFIDEAILPKLALKETSSILCWLSHEQSQDQQDQCESDRTPIAIVIVVSRK
jgi:hypothetical protein